MTEPYKTMANSLLTVGDLVQLGPESSVFPYGLMIVRENRPLDEFVNGLIFVVIMKEPFWWDIGAHYKDVAYIGRTHWMPREKELLLDTERASQGLTPDKRAFKCSKCGVVAYGDKTAVVMDCVACGFDVGPGTMAPL